MWTKYVYVCLRFSNLDSIRINLRLKKMRISEFDSNVIINMLKHAK